MGVTVADAKIFMSSESYTQNLGCALAISIIFTLCSLYATIIYIFQKLS